MMVENKKLIGVVSPPYGLGEGIGHSGKSQLAEDLKINERYGNIEGNIGNILNTEINEMDKRLNSYKKTYN